MLPKLMLSLVLVQLDIYIFMLKLTKMFPENVIEGFRVGAKTNDKLHMLIPQGGTVTEYAARIVMDGTLTCKVRS